MVFFSGLPGWAGTRKIKPIWILLKRETVSGSGISWAICKSAPGSRQITTPAPHQSVFYRPDALPAAQPTASKHWRQIQYWIKRVVNWSTRASPRRGNTARSSLGCERTFVKRCCFNVADYDVIQTAVCASKHTASRESWVGFADIRLLI